MIFTFNWVKIYSKLAKNESSTVIVSFETIIFTVNWVAGWISETSQLYSKEKKISATFIFTVQWVLGWVLMISMVTFGSSPPRVECALQQALMYIKKRKWKSQFYSHCPCCRSYSRQCKFWRVVWVNSEKSTKSLERQLYDHCIQEIKGRTDFWEIARAAVGGDCNSLNSDFWEIARMIVTLTTLTFETLHVLQRVVSVTLSTLSLTPLSLTTLLTAPTSRPWSTLSLSHTHTLSLSHTHTQVSHRYLGFWEILGSLKNSAEQSLYTVNCQAS